MRKVGMMEDQDYNLEELLHEGSSAASNDDHLVKRGRNNKKLLAVAVGGLAALGVTGAMIFANPFAHDNGNLTVGQQKGGSAITDSTGSDPSSNPSNATKNANKPNPSAVANFWTNESGLILPKPLEKWQTMAYNLSSATDREALKVKYSNTSLAFSSKRLPSERSGFTSDPSKRLTPKGTLNPLYTTITDEDYQLQVEQAVERVINPFYGEWRHLQYSVGKASHNFNLSDYSNMFSPEYIQKNQGKPYKEYIPFYADWSENDYGMANQLLEDGPRWYGVVNKMSSTFKYDAAAQQYSSDVTVELTYHAWNKNQEELTKPATLNLSFITKPNNNAPAKLLINGASLKVS